MCVLPTGWMPVRSISPRSSTRRRAEAAKNDGSILAPARGLPGDRLVARRPVGARGQPVRAPLICSSLSRFGLQKICDAARSKRLTPTWNRPEIRYLRDDPGGGKRRAIALPVAAGAQLAGENRVPTRDPGGAPRSRHLLDLHRGRRRLLRPSRPRALQDEAVLSDRNPALIEVYGGRIGPCDGIIRALNRFPLRTAMSFRIRILDPAVVSSAELAASTISSEQDGYNGLYR